MPLLDLWKEQVRTDRAIIHYNYLEIFIRLTKHILLIVMTNKINHSKKLLWTICAILARNSDHSFSKRDEVSEQLSCGVALFSPEINMRVNKRCSVVSGSLLRYDLAWHGMAWHGKVW